MTVVARAKTSQLCAIDFRENDESLDASTLALYWSMTPVYLDYRLDDVSGLSITGLERTGRTVE